MLCHKCGQGTMVEKTGTLPWRSLLIGNIRIPGITFRECTRCKSKSQLINGDQARAMEKVYLQLEHEAVGKLPIGLFVTTKEASEFLGTTPVEFRRMPRVRNGFIVSHKIGDTMLWLRASVEQFKETKDGRLNVKNLLTTRKKQKVN